MVIDVKSPACLPLGVTRLLRHDEETTCILGISVTYPPVHLTAKASQSLECHGPRADIAYVEATKVIELGQLSKKSQIQIELAIPVGMGLYSDTMLSLCTAKAVAWTNNLDDETNLAALVGLGPADVLGLAAFNRGGLLMVDLASRPLSDDVVERREIAHARKDAWALVMFLPKLPGKAPRDVEVHLKEAAASSALGLDARQGTELSQLLFNALAHDDINLFGAGISELQEYSFAAMKYSGALFWQTEISDVFYDVVRGNGAVAWGRSLTGLALWALVKGEVACIETQKALQRKLGYYSGRILSTITDNVGAQFSQKHDSTLISS